jgi:hypothetical protein
MGKIIGELIFGLVRFLVVLVMESFLAVAAKNFITWLDPKIRGRYTRLIVFGLLGIVAYFFLPIVMGLVMGLF